MLIPTENFKDISKPLNDFLVLFKAYLIFKDFSRKPSKFKYFQAYVNPNGIGNLRTDFGYSLALTGQQTM